MNNVENDRDRIVARDGEAFYSRWSRRKQDADKQHDQTPVADPEVESTPAAPPLCDGDMPAIESLDAESDYSGFLSPEVSDRLRRLALRKLFHAASFNVRDGLDDYDEDFTQFDKLGGLITSDMRHQLERLAADGAESRKREEADSLPPDPETAAGENEEIERKGIAEADRSATADPAPDSPGQDVGEKVRS